MFTLFRYRTAGQVTIRLQNGDVRAALSGPEAHTYALVDGLLWWLLCQRIQAFVASYADVPGLNAFAMPDHGIGDRLVRYVFTTPFHNYDAPQAQHTMRTILTHLPQLASLAMTPEREAQHAYLMQLAELLQSRIAHEGEAGHGVQFTDENKAAA